MDQTYNFDELTKLYNDTLIEYIFDLNITYSGDYIYSYENIQPHNTIINKLISIRASAGNLIKLEHLKCMPILDGISRLIHPYFISYIWKLIGKKDIIKYTFNNKYDNMPHIYNKDTTELNIKAAVKDMLEWMYIGLYHDCLRGVSNNINIQILDEYSKIFNITYNKKQYNIDRCRQQYPFLYYKYGDNYKKYIDN